MSRCYVQYGPIRPKGRRRLERHGSQFSDIHDKPDILMIIFIGSDILINLIFS